MRRSGRRGIRWTGAPVPAGDAGRPRVAGLFDAVAGALVVDVLAGGIFVSVDGLARLTLLGFDVALVFT
jgi:hypothetical protein